MIPSNNTKNLYYCYILPNFGFWYDQKLKYSYMSIEMHAILRYVGSNDCPWNTAITPNLFFTYSRSPILLIFKEIMIWVGVLCDFVVFTYILYIFYLFCCYSRSLWGGWVPKNLFFTYLFAILGLFLEATPAPWNTL